MNIHYILSIIKRVIHLKFIVMKKLIFVFGILTSSINVIYCQYFSSLKEIPTSNFEGYSGAIINNTKFNKCNLNKTYATADLQYFDIPTRINIQNEDNKIFDTEFRKKFKNLDKQLDARFEPIFGSKYSIYLVDIACIDTTHESVIVEIYDSEYFYNKKFPVKFGSGYGTFITTLEALETSFQNGTLMIDIETVFNKSKEITYDVYVSNSAKK